MAALVERSKQEKLLFSGLTGPGTASSQYVPLYAAKVDPNIVVPLTARTFSITCIGSKPHVTTTAEGGISIKWNFKFLSTEGVGMHNHNLKYGTSCMKIMQNEI